MDLILIVLLVLLLGGVFALLYLNLRPKLKDEIDNKETEEIEFISDDGDEFIFELEPDYDA